MSQLIWTALNNGEYKPSGAGYGFKITYEDRIKHFQRTWKSVIIILPAEDENIEIAANVDKKSFWSPPCGELISKKIGNWLIKRGFSRWPQGQPPKLKISVDGDRRFKIEES